MAVTVSCRCGQRLAVQEQYVGKAVACPACREVFTVPVPVTTVPPPTPPPPPPAPPVEELVELTPAEPQEELVELSMVDTLELAKTPGEEEGGTYQVEGGDMGNVDLSVAGGLGRIRLRANAIRCLAYGPDHQSALAADEDTVHFVDLKARKGIPTRPIHRAAISCLALSADGTWALSGDQDGRLLLWDVPRRRPVRWLEGARGEVLSAAFSPGGGQAVSGDAAGVIRVWDLATGQPLPLRQARGEGEASCVGFSPDGRLVLGIGSEGRPHLWSLRTGELVSEMAKGSAGLSTAAFSPDGATVLASCGDEFRVRRWSVRNGERIPCFPGAAKKHPRIQRSFVAPNGRAVLTLGFAAEFGPRNRDDSPTFLERQLLGPAAWFVYKTAANAMEAAKHAGTGGDYVLEFWDVATQVGVSRAVVGPEEPLALTSSYDGHRILAGFEGGHIGLYAL
jgi:WD domain, G-beta repeat